MTGKQDQQVEQTPTGEKKTVKPRRTTVRNVNGQDEEVDFTPAPRHHASESMTFLATRASQQAKEGKDVGIPAAATPEALSKARWVPLPAGGIAALADELFPEDRDDAMAMHNHIFDLMTMNRDNVRNDTDHRVGQFVRIP